MKDKRSEDDSGLIRVHFTLLATGNPQWPPAAGETLWCERLGGNEFRVENVPFLVYDLSCHDVVIAMSDPQWNMPEFLSVVQRSGHQTFRLQPTRRGAVGRIARLFDELGCCVEAWDLGNRLPLVSLDVPPSVDVRPIFIALERGEETRRWRFERASVPPWDDVPVITRCEC